jgi:subfamily B ATP-binding cassette protein MsbA
MNKLNKVVSNNFETFSFFYKNLRSKIFIVLLLSIFVGVLDGIGLSMFLPLLQSVSETESFNGEHLGSLKFIVDFIEALGFNLTVGVILLFLLFFFVIKGIVRYLSGAYLVKVQQFFITKIRINLLDALNKISFKYFVKSDIGQIQNVFTLEVNRLYRGFKNYFTALEQGVLVIVYTSFAFLVDVQFALLVTVGGLVTNFIYRYIYKITRKASKDFTTGSNLYQGQVIQHITNFKYLKATAFLIKFGKRLKTTIREVERSNRKIGILNAFVMAVREPLLITIVVAVIYYQVTFLNKSLGPILISLLFFYRALGALMNVQNSWNNYLGVSGSVSNVIDFQKELQNKKETFGTKEFNDIKAEIKLVNLSFSYDDEVIFKDINLTIKKNDFIVIKGHSGSGKTTLVNIICGLLKPTKGEVYVDSINIKEFASDELQKQIGYITQEPVIFNDSIFNNVTLWQNKTQENLNEFKRILKKTGAYDFVYALPKGEDEMLTNLGSNFSGGQKQRLAIARELYKKPSILIVDEGTSALDEANKQIINQLLFEYSGKLTIILISHESRNTNNKYERIIEMDNRNLKIIK